MGYRCIKDKDGSLFQIVDVPGDGNCFFHSAALSRLINVSEHKELRNVLVQRIIDVLSHADEHQDIISFVENILHCKVLPWLDNIKERNTWGDSYAAAFLAYIFQVKVRIVSNFERGFFYNDIHTVSALHGFNIIPIDAKTIHLYHYLFQKPYLPSKHCNHFSYLQEMNSLEVLPENIYTGGIPYSNKKTVEVETANHDIKTLNP